ncbi:DUF262 domain-containing protein [Achromobacter dolens]|uniref:DUF262 domain-containing protein n=1 Tax=Achromobacter dolens TaxID=1287738 RepID=UPI003557237F
MKIESHDRNIRELLGADYYVIPRFQRPYSWDSENIADFWNDVVVNSSPDYFIGSMVVYTFSGKLGVVDGQQRLTTIMILMSCLRDALSENGFLDQANGLHKLIERENIENQKEFVLQTQTSYPYFQAHILSQDPGDVPAKMHREEDRIRDAHAQFKNLISDLLGGIEADPALSEKKKKSDTKKRLISIRDSLLSLKVILVTLDSEDDAYLIFETLNTRGKDLALADLVKNHFTKTLKHKNKGLDRTSISWAKLRETIEGKRELDSDTFIYHWWLSKYEYTAQKNIYKEFRKIVQPANAQSVLNDMVTASDYYRAIHDPDFWKWEKTQVDARSSLVALNLFRVRQQVPATLSLVRAFKAGKVNLSQLTKALGEIEKFHFLFTAITSQRSSGGISAMYALLARQIAAVPNSQDATRILRDMREKLRERVPTEAEFLAVFPDLVYTATLSKERQLMKYVLAKLSRKAGQAFPADLDELTIEHLVPQSAIDGKAWTEEVVGQIGNLMLVTKSVNQRLEKKSFKEKKAILKEQHKKMLPDYFWQADQLDPELIKRRTNELGVVAYSDVWKI